MVIVAAEHHGEVKHLASFLILELVQMTQRQDHVTALTPQLLVVSLVKSYNKDDILHLSLTNSPFHALPGVLDGRSSKGPWLVKLWSVAQHSHHPQLPRVTPVCTDQIQHGVINLPEENKVQNFYIAFHFHLFT